MFSLPVITHDPFSVTFGPEKRLYCNAITMANRCSTIGPCFPRTLHDKPTCWVSTSGLCRWWTVSFHKTLKTCVQAPGRFWWGFCLIASSSWTLSSPTSGLVRSGQKSAKPFLSSPFIHWNLSKRGAAFATLLPNLNPQSKICLKISVFNDMFFQDCIFLQQNLWNTKQLPIK